MPLKTPAPDNVRPAGITPAVSVQVYGAVPPAAAKFCEYAAPTIPLGSGDGVVTLSAEVTGTVIGREAIFDTASVT